MNKILLSLLMISLSISYLLCQPETIWQLLQNGDIIKWVYTFGDEFNENELDSSKWNECYQWGCDQNKYNGYFLHGPNYHILENGVLKLVTRYNPGYYTIWHWDDNGNFYTTQEYRKYTSGMISSKKKFKYGLFEIRFKLPKGKGLWPAFWLYGGNPNEEFDIFEYKGENPNKIHIDMHCPGNNCDNFGSWFTANGDFSSGFNDMMGEWGPNFSFWYLNGHEFAIWLGNLNYQAFLIANMGVASNCSTCSFSPGPDNSTPLPAYFLIDYIRVWTRLDCDSNKNICNYNQSEVDENVLTGKKITMGGANCSSSINNGQNLDLIATDKIVLNSGFHSQLGGVFHAKIVNCPSPQNNITETINSSSDFQIVSKDNTVDNVKDSKEIKSETALYTKIYPNPSKGKITIEFDGEIKCNIKIQLINSEGDIIFSDNHITKNKIYIDISKLSPGIYTLIGVFNNNSVSKKIILK